MADVPALTGVTMPDDEPIVALVGLPLVHVPPDTVLVSVTAASEQMRVIPLVTPGIGFTVTTAVLKQPVVASVWVIVAVPLPTPTTVVVLAVPVTVATPVLLLVHAPVPLDVSVKEFPSHNSIVPEILAGTASTVTMSVTTQDEPVV
jgi:hypothetical protein